MHREAMASLQYCIETGRGFFALIAPPGMGKTTLLFHTLEKYNEIASTAFLFNTQCDSREFIRFLLSEVGIEDETDDVVRLHRRFNQFLLANSRAGRRFILIVDEAQNLSEEVLETIRLLSDFETPRAKLMQIILAGQPELDSTLGRASMSQLLQRISMVGRIHPLSTEDVRSYIDHRLAFAGYRGEPIFSDEAAALIARSSHGTPRLINTICFNSLSLGYVAQERRINADLVAEAVADLPALQSTPVLGRENTIAQNSENARPVSNLKRRPRVSRTFQSLRAEPSITAPVAAQGMHFEKFPKENSELREQEEPAAAASPNALRSPMNPKSLSEPPRSEDSAYTKTVQSQAALQFQPASVFKGAKDAETSPVLEGVVPLSNSVYARPRSTMGAIGKLALALVVLMGCATLGYFVFKSRIATTLYGKVESVNAASPVESTATESLSSRTLTSEPMVATGKGDDEQRMPLETVEPRSLGDAPDSVARLGDRTSYRRRMIHKEELDVAPIIIRPIDGAPTNNSMAPSLNARTGTGTANSLVANTKTPPIIPHFSNSSLPGQNPGYAAIVHPVLIERTLPQYPPAMGNSYAEGEVVLTARVNELGLPEDLKFVRGDPVFKKAALDAVTQWKYKPGTYNGKPTEMPVEIRFRFSH
jgi:TonB family protein